MKKNKILIGLGIITTFVLSIFLNTSFNFSNLSQSHLDVLNATTNKFKAGETIYFKVESSKWDSNNARFGACFKINGDISDYWSEFKYFNYKDNYKKVYKAVIPSTKPSYDYVIFTRHNGENFNGPSWDNKWNQSGDISAPSDGNNFFYKNSTGDNDWDGWKLEGNNGVSNVGKPFNVYIDINKNQDAEQKKGYLDYSDKQKEYESTDVEPVSGYKFKRFTVFKDILGKKLTYSYYEGNTGTSYSIDKYGTLTNDEHVNSKILSLSSSNGKNELVLDSSNPTDNGTKPLTKEFAKELFEIYDPCDKTDNTFGLKSTKILKNTYFLGIQNKSRESLALATLDDIDNKGINGYTALDKLIYMENEYSNLSSVSGAKNFISNNKKSVVIAGASIGGIAILGCFGLFLKKRKFN